MNTTTRFNGYESYLFNYPSRDYRSEEIELFNKKVDEQGSATLDQTLTLGKNAPGMLRVNFLVKAYETGGDFSIDAFSKKYAPYESYVGLQSPKEDDYGSYPTKVNHQFQVVTLTKRASHC